MKTLITDTIGDRTTLNQLYEQLHLNLLPGYPHLQASPLNSADYPGKLPFK